jgi:general secretion pathway protein G
MIELLVVLSIIMILSSIALVQYRNSVTAAKEAVLRADLHLMRDAVDQYYADKGAYPASLDSLVSEGYLRAIPDDPFNKGRKDNWVTTASEPDPNNPTAASGVYDVKLASEATALDGSKYADW